MIKKQVVTLLAALSCATSPIMGQQKASEMQDEQKEKRMEWFADAKLGIFIHWAEKVSIRCNPFTDGR